MKTLTYLSSPFSTLRMSTRINNLTGLRAIAAIGILLMHYWANSRNVPDMGIITSRVIPWFTNFVFLFFIVSAFGMCCGYFEKVKDGMPPGMFYPKRYMRILPFYALLCIIDIVVDFSPETAAQAFVNLTFTNGLVTYPGNISVIGVGWFLGVIFIFYMMFPFFVFITSNRRRAWMAFTATAILSVLGLTYFFTSRFVPLAVPVAPRNYIFCTAVFFVAGALIYHYKDVIYGFVERYGLVFGLFTVIVTVGYWCLFVPTSTVMEWGGIFVISAMMLTACIGPDSRLLNNRIITLVGQYSFEIYICHMFIFRVMEKAGLTDLISNAELNYIVTAAVGLTASTLFAIGFNSLWDKAKQLFISDKAKQP